MPAKLNKAFWRWFGDSVVRNEDGSPMVVYHGTPAMPYNIRYVEYLCEAARIAFKHVGEPYPGDDEIARRMTSWHNTIVEFSRKNPEVIPEDILAQLAQYIPFSTFERGHHYRPDQDARIGFYFTPNERFARNFMSVVEYDPMLGAKKEVYVGYPHLYAAYLRIEHPLDLTLATKSNAEFLKTTGHLNVETADEVRSYLRSAGGSKMLQQSFARLGVEKLKSLGFDGIINKVKFLGRQEIELSVFDPDQIKSIDNDGTWDHGDPNIGSNPRKASAPNETYTLRHVVDHLKKTDGTGDPEWMRHLIKEVSPYPVWELHSLDPREVKNHCSDKETAEEYAEVINELPPAVAIPSSDTGRLELVDGGHRFYAASLVGTAFPCYIPAGMRGLK